MTSSITSGNLFSRVSDHFEALPTPKTEESFLLRVMVQLMVIVGIVATDVAAQTTWSIWAIPLSIAGAVWSWHRRKEKNIALKFILAIAMLVMLFAFLGNLVENLNATQVSLAGLLVQLQVLHSFDLPRRKDLGYSMVIGLILLGVAGTLSQTLAFSPWLILFLAVAIPALILDYGSRLGLTEPLFAPKADKEKSRRRPQPHSAIAWKRWVSLLALTLVIGLGIFAVMPRFRGYQVQSFPVGDPGDMQDQSFDEQNEGIDNPGYREEEDLEGKGNRPGSVDSTSYYGFNTQMNQNLRGEMEKQLVLRVRSQAPGFWKALSFDIYTGQGWEISDRDDVSKLRRSPWSYRFRLPEFYTQMRTETVIQTYTLVEDLPNVIPALYQPQAVYFPTREIGIDQSGSLRSPVGLLEDLTYTVISLVPVRNRTILQQYRIPDNVNIHPRILQIPEAIREPVRAKAEELMAKADRPLETPYEIALYLAQALKQNYRIQPELPFFGEDQDLVMAFLYDYQGGLPDHFSTALTMMLRSLGIPARLTVGFAPGQYNPFTGLYLVHNTDAYALTEVLFPGLGWYAFDPIPGHDLYPPSIEDVETFGVLKQIWRWVAGWLPSPITGFFGTLGEILTNWFIKALRWFWNFASGSLIGGILGLILAISAGFAGWLGWQQLAAWFHRRKLASYPPTAQLYFQLLDLLQEQGYRKSRAQTPGEFAQSLREHLQPEQVEVIATIAESYTAWRYGDCPANLDYLRQQLRHLRKSFQKQNLRLVSKRS